MDQNPLKNQAASPFSSPSGTLFFKKEAGAGEPARAPDFRHEGEEKSLQDRIPGQSGSIFVWIFIMIGLFAAISFVLAQNSRTSVGTMSNERAKLTATEIIGYAQKLRESVHQLRIEGCADTQISFGGELIGDYDYSNPETPGDGRCLVFGPQGGALRWPSSPVENARWFIAGIHCYQGAGATQTCSPEATDLELNILNIPDSLCMKINESAEIGAVIPQENYNASPPQGRFQGVFSGSNSSASRIEGIGATGKPYGCYKDDTGVSSGQNIFYYILIAR